MKCGVRQFSLYFAIQCLSYGVFCWNLRVVAQARYLSIFASDLCFAAISFTLIRKVAEAKSGWAQVGYILGGACGSLVSVWITRRLYGQ